MDDLTVFLKSSAFTLPYLLIQILGIILSLVFRSRLPKVWIAAVLAFLVLLIGNVSWIIYNAVAVFVFYRSNDYETANAFGFAQGVFQSLTGFVGYLLLFIALFRRRDPAAIS